MDILRGVFGQKKQVKANGPFSSDSPSKHAKNLQSKDQEKAALSAIALGRLGYRESVDEMVRALKGLPNNPTFIVGRAAIYSLGVVKYGEAADAIVGTDLGQLDTLVNHPLALWFARQTGESSVSTLGKVLRDPATTRAMDRTRNSKEILRVPLDAARSRAVAMLGMTASPNAVPLLLDTDYRDSTNIGEALLALGELALPHARERLSSESTSTIVKERAMVVLSRFGDLSDLSLLKAYWHSSSLSLCLDSLVAGARLGEEGALDVLSKMDAHHPRTEEERIRALERTGSSRAAEVVLQKLKETSWGVPIYTRCLEALSRVRCQEAGEYLLDRAKQEQKEHRSIVSMLPALANQRHPDIIPFLVNVALSKDERPFQEVVIGLAMMDDPMAHQALFDVFQTYHMHERIIRAVMIAGLEQCVPTLREIVKAVGAAIRNKQIDHRHQTHQQAYAAAIEGLGFFRDRQSVPLLLSEYKEKEARGYQRTIVDALCRIGDTSSIDSYFQIFEDRELTSHNAPYWCRLILKASDEKSKDRLSADLEKVSDPQAHMVWDGTWDENLITAREFGFGLRIREGAWTWRLARLRQDRAPL